MANRASRRQLAFPPQKKDRFCRLCNRHHHHLSSPAEWRNEQARAYVLSLQVTPESFVCRPCRDDVTRVLTNSKYVPRWAKGSASNANTHHCCVCDCKKAAFVSSTLGNSDQMRHAFASTGMECVQE